MRHPLLIVLMTFFLTLSVKAEAAIYYLELGQHETRDAARDAVDDLGAVGSSLRVTRRYVRGEGWRYVVRLDGIATRAEAQSQARALSALAPTIQIYEGRGYRRRMIDEIAGAASLTAKTQEEDGSDGTDKVPSASQVLRLAVQAHGGRNGGAARIRAADGLRVSFESRTIVGDEELRVHHIYYRQHGQSRLEVDVLAGEGQSNVVVLAAPDKAWVATKEEVTPRDGVQTAEMLARFAPVTGLLSIPLGFGQDVRDAAEWRGLETTGRVQHGGLTHLRVAPDAHYEGAPNPLEAALFRDDTRHLSQVTWITRGGRVTFEYSDYRPVVDQVVVPHRVRVERDGKLVEEIEVKRFEVDPVLESGLFDEPVVLRGRRHR